MSQVDTTTWKEYNIGNLFPKIIKPAVYHTKDVEEEIDGIPYVVRSKFNNGVKCYVKRPKSDINPANVISFGAENTRFFYQTREWVSGRDMYYIDTRHLDEPVCLFLTACLQPIAKKYSYNFGLFPDLLKKEKIKLPADTDGKPDFAYMETYIRNIKNTSVFYLNKLRLAKDLEKIKCDSVNWGSFSIGSLFDVVKGTRLTRANMKEGTIRFIGASAINNGITAYISNNEHIHPANTITVSYNGSVGEAFYQNEPFWASDDVNILYPRFDLNEDIALFLIPVLRKVGQKYKFIDKWKKEDMEKTCLKLPVNIYNEPDFEYMEKCIRVLREKHGKYLTILLSIANNMH